MLESTNYLRWPLFPVTPYCNTAMNLQPRSALLDVDWLIRTEAAEGYDSLLAYVRAGAETYDGPVTAVAEAVLALRRTRGPRFGHGADLRHALAHAFASGSWSPEAGRLQRSSCFQWLYPLFKPDAVARLSAQYARCEPPAIPQLEDLQLRRPLDGAWVGHSDGIWTCEISPDGRHLASGSRDGDVAVWDMDSGTLIARGRSGEPEVRDCVITPDGRRVISVHGSGTITVWDVRTMERLSSFVAPRQHFEEPFGKAMPHLGGSSFRWRRVAVSADSLRVAVAGGDAIELWELAPARRITTLHFPQLQSGIIALYFASDAAVVLIARSDPLQVLTYDLASGQVASLSTLERPRAKVLNRVLPTPNRQFIIGSSGEETTAWKVDADGRVASVDYGTTGQAIAVSPDGTLVAIAGFEKRGAPSDEILQLLSIPDLREIQRWNLTDLGCRDIVSSLAFSPDGTHVVVAGWDGVLRRVARASS
jgi:hypothetical protein